MTVRDFGLEKRGADKENHTTISPNVLQARLLRTVRGRDYEKLMAVANPAVHYFVAETVELCTPTSVFVCSDSPDDVRYVQQQAIALGEENPLATEGHTIHFDSVEDQGRDREVTKYLVPKTDTLSKTLVQVEREKGLVEICDLLRGSMKGRTMIVRFLSLGPTNSIFSIPCVQCTDSFYVAHSEDLLYRKGYEQMRKLGEKVEFFRFVHSAGKLDKNMVSGEPEKKRIYIDYIRDTIYSVNTQYAGNTVGLKKLALRLTIRKADRESWLAEHMLLMGVKGPNGRKTYFAGAFPSACGKTSTAMLPGETILGDDIAYFRNINGEAHAVNAEFGIFGIIQNVKATTDPVIYEVLTKPGEVIFSNVLIKEGRPYWLGMGSELPKDGVNFSGRWWQGKKDKEGKEILPAHKNARYTVCLKALANVDPELENSRGVPIGGIMYGGRDSYGYPPVQQSFDWDHGIVAYGASLETETTFAIIGKEGVPEINLMSIQDFVAIPLGKYIQNNLNFAKGLKKMPLVFGVNYFLRDKEGKFVEKIMMRDKAVWMKWMELRVHGDARAIKSPTGWIPKYEDLARLFKQVLQTDYTKEDYLRQFTVRVKENLAKMERVEKYHRTEVLDAPSRLFEVLAEQRKRLTDAKEHFGDYISPEKLPEEGRAN
jgi:phosphoenolpyruvate carboxykinase (GTP)